MPVLASIIDKRSFRITVVQVIRMTRLSDLQFNQVASSLILFVSKSCVAIRTHCLNKANKDYVVASWILRDNTAINKCKRSVKNWRACGSNMETRMTKMLVAFG